MHTMRKGFLLAICMMMLAGLLAACSGNSGNKGNDTGSSKVETTKQNTAKNNEKGEEAKTPEQISISVYYPTPDREADRKLEDDKIRRFEEAYPHVKIIKADWQYNPAEIGIKMGANEAPTLFNTYATEGKFLAERGWAADITELWDSYMNKDQFNPVLADQFILNGKVHGIPQKGYVVGTVMNLKMLRDKGVAIPSFDWTWDDLLQTAQAIADPGAGISGIALMGKGNEAGWNWTNFLFEAGGDIQQVADGKVTATFNSDAGLKALELYNKLRWEANAIPTDWALGWGDAVGSFGQGRTAMVVAGPDGPVDHGLNQGGMNKEDIAVYPMPAQQAGGKHTGVLGGDYLVINPNASSAEQEAAFQYATFDYFSDAAIVSAEESIKARQAEGKSFIPPVIEYFKMDSEYGMKMKALYDKYPNVYQYDQAMLNLLDGKPEAQFNTQEFYGAMTNVVQEVFSKKDVDLKAALDKAAATVQETVFDSIKVE
jgi:multiple sugar transport system substrate-binding protein